jgi:hypothetical protein
MPPSSGLLFMQLGFMQRLTTLPTCQSTEICQRHQGNRIPFELEIATLEALGAWEVLEYDSETMPNVIQCVCVLTWSPGREGRFQY